MTSELKCPSCGAPAMGERRCSFCGSGVATVRCARCFHMSSPAALHCEGCGGELGLEPIADTARLTCPGCAVELSAFAGETGQLYDCGRCGGQFVEVGLLRDLLERRALLGRAVPRRPLARATESGPVRYVPCPACSTLMGRKNFGGTSGVIVDVCVKHGIWFDAGELPRVLDFVEKGGLAEERRREAEERKREHAARKIPDAESVVVPRVSSGMGVPDPTIHHATPPAWAHGFADDARAAWATILEQIGRALERHRR